MEDSLNYVAIASLIEDHWNDFVELCGSEDEASHQEEVIRGAAGMSTATPS